MRVLAVGVIFVAALLTATNAGGCAYSSSRVRYAFSLCRGIVRVGNRKPRL